MGSVMIIVNIFILLGIGHLDCNSFMQSLQLCQ